MKSSVIAGARLLQRVIALIVACSGHLCAWLLLALVVATTYDVAMRYVFEAGSVAVQEAEWHLFAAIFLLAAASTLRADNHVRVDLVYRSRFVSERVRGVIDWCGTLFALLPFCALVIWASLPFVIDAWVHHEMSPDPGGLSQRWAVKAMIPLGFLLLALEGVARLLKPFTRTADD